MSENQWPTQDELVELLVRMDIAMDPAELQGVVLGRLAGAPCATPDQHWEAFTNAFGDLSSENESWQGLLRKGLSTLQSDEMDLELLLPDEARALEERLEALAAWCRGFLFGIGIAQLSDDDLAVEELAESLEDVRQISCVGVDDAVGEVSEQESAYQELIEYLRMVPYLFFSTRYNDIHNARKQ